MSDIDEVYDDFANKVDASPITPNTAKSLEVIWDDDKIERVSNRECVLLQLNFFSFLTLDCSMLTMKEKGNGDAIGVAEVSNSGTQQRLYFMLQRHQVVMSVDAPARPSMQVTNTSTSSFFRNRINGRYNRDRLSSLRNGHLMSI